MADCK